MLLNQKCIPCSLGTPPLSKEDIAGYLPELDNDWIVDQNKLLKRMIEFKNFAESFDFVCKIADLAEEQGHHPDIRFGWGYVSIHLTTHKINGLSESDFIMAAKIDAL
ncbi:MULTISPECIES: 4a-hydroxytetrahydrobiopterin dehydratase [unclassified Fusibacter]|uniref:4a-hydroxytetrahydrobiopterin dehydratase n=1 Tax=unclassified Fusibacter TaxID=2624464 RepID=UPI00101172CC|nr:MULTISPECIES: 4a-hydroxytetrahydrobiopterin dehydratase [unclassified Fusibacter]MCK8060589.1 4a-hydroxytetrahydrobiopterin dehydratase [Fusibacter sp. A2]NPE22957.1 4a-hydroxytetrahydrobiopterin dehydratase [Fusibacter sp. A1]RXV60023.1 4a-hydroxytetrahydrobiopterin dehydratase [Fusibacter sp. A1]